MAYALLPRIDELAKKLERNPSETLPHLQVQRDLEALRRMVRRIHAVLNDAERMEIHQESVRLWLRELKDVAYDADDILDEYQYELLRAEVENPVQADEAIRLAYRQTHKKGKFRKIWRRWFSKTAHQGSTSDASTATKSIIPSISSEASIWGEIAEKIGTIRGRFEEISQQREALHLTEGEGEMQFQNTVDHLPTSHVVDEQKVYGRGEELEKVVSWLLYSDECKKTNLSVLPVVGMGGVGKTTLVRHVFNDHRICGHFQIRGWVCVSDDFRVEKLTARITESLTKRECHLKEFSVLQEKLKDLLDGKRFLLVLDDVWNEKQSLWESLQRPLRFGAKGSAVITTTRNDPVAKIMQTMPFHRLGCLSVDACWELFLGSAFVDRHADDCQDLVEIGKKIVRKCGGLPLAAKTLGGLLSYETDISVWKAVLQSNIWDLGDRGDGIIPALRLSYLHLPGYLKQCFLHASTFPKDFIFRKTQIVQLWMAHGFLQCNDGKPAEDVGDMYFKELVQRSSFQYYPGLHVNKEDPCFVIHDLIHDLAQHISGQEFFQMEGDGHAHVPYLNTVRHLSVVNQKLEDLEKVLHAPWAIRTLMVKVTWGDLKLPSQMLQLLQSLRALDLHSSRINELPDPVGTLKHLRYLNLNYTGIETLPDSICKLYNLQTLSLLYCRSLRRLPRDIKNLINLRCLMIEGTNIEFLPRGFGKLTSLRALDEFRVGFRRHPISGEDLPRLTEEDFNCLSLQPSNEECGGIKELKDLIYLRGRLEISNLQWVMSIANDAAVADLRNKQNIRELILRWNRDNPASPRMQELVLESLRPPNHLQMLRIYGYHGLRLPTWLGSDPSPLSKLVRVVMRSCSRCTCLPPLGQLPSLKYLEVEGFGAVNAIGIEFYGPASVGFPALEELVFSHMNNLVTWELAAERGDVFPRLRLLSLLFCDKLESMVPLYRLPALEVLHIWHCQRLRSIELWRGSPLSGPPPLRNMTVVDCQQAHFSTQDDEHLFLPPTLRDLSILGCAVLLDWCERGGGTRFAHIPKARFWTKRNDNKRMLSTSVPKVDNGQLVLRFSGYRSSHSETKVHPQGNDEED